MTSIGVDNFTLSTRLSNPRRIRLRGYQPASSQGASTSKPEGVCVSEKTLEEGHSEAFKYEEILSYSEWFDEPVPVLSPV